LKKPFDEKALPLEVRKQYKANKKNLTTILDYLDEHYQDVPLDNVQLALFISYIEIECAIQVYVDDVGTTLQKVRARLEQFPESPQAVSYLKDLEKLEKAEKRRRNRLEKLMAMDFDSLDLSDKKDVAYELADSKNETYKALGARYFLQLYQETNNLHLFCNYATTLYQSGSKEEALKEYEKIEEMFREEVYPNKDFVMDNIHADRMDFFREDRLEFRKHWDAAKTDPYLQERANSFPSYHRFITEFAEVSLQFGYMDICDELAARMKKERLPFPPKVKEYYGG
jgi:tetratricopeptide (TPR) repeat protein